VIRSVIRVYAAAFSGLRRDVWLLAFVAFVNRSGTMVLPFIALYLTYERGLGVAMAGRLLSVYGLGSMVGAYLGGWLTDRIGAARAQAVTLIASGVGFLVLAGLRSLTGIAVALFLLSVVTEGFRPANMAAFAERAPAEIRLRAFALLRLAVNLGMAVGPALGGVLARYSYTWLFVVDAATSWVAAALLPLAFKGPKPSAPTPETGAVRLPSSPWRDGPFLLLMLLMVGLATVFYQIFSTLPVYLHQSYGPRENGIGLLLAFNALLIVAFEMVLVHWAQRRELMPLIGLGAFLVCTGFGLMPLGTSVPFAALTIVVWTFGEMLALPLVTAVVAERAQAKNRGRYMGLYTMAFSLAFVFAPAAGTYVYESFGPKHLWFGIGVLGPLMWVASMALRAPFRRTRSGASE
jgi:MFS family permease